MSANILKYNQDELEAPTWLDSEFFTGVLRSSQKDESIQVKNVKLSPATLKGDHYASIMFRATVDYESTIIDARIKNTISMIIKTMPELDGTKKGMLKESYIFETEIGIYKDVIPKFEAILKDVGDDTNFGAKCLYHSLAPKKIIIFEDLVPHGYEVVRDRCINMEEAKLSYLKLAKFHALGFKLNQENPLLFDKFSHHLFELSTLNESFFNGGIIHFIEMLDTQPGLKKYKPYFEALKPSLIDSCRASFEEYRTKPQNGGLYVLCHGDFHNKNMMFTHSDVDDRPDDVMLLDFQMSYVGPMVLDVIYSVFMLLDRDLRTQHLDELLHYYFSNFVDTLKHLKFDGRIPKLLEFRQKLVEHKNFEIMLLVTFLPIWHAFRGGDNDPDQIISSQDYRRQTYYNKHFLAELEEALPRYLHLGYLDI